MDIQVIKNRFTDVLKKRDAYLTMAMASLVLNILLALVLFLHQPNARTIIVPAGFKQTFWVDNQGVSASALAEMTRYFSLLKLNMTPESSQSQIHQILKYTNPATYGQLKAQLINQADRLAKEGLTTAFFPVDVKVDVPHLQAMITGDLSYFIGQQVTKQDRVSYLAQYSYHNGRLYLDAFKEVEKHA